MTRRHPSLPAIWLVSDARNDAVLEAALARLPRGSGIIFRHYHLAPAERRARFDRLARIARARGHLVIVAGSRSMGRHWGADGSYGATDADLMTAHSLRQIGAANRARAAAVLLSPVFATRSHPGAKPLGLLRFRLLADRSLAPVIALGGMTAHRARRLQIRRWAAIDGLSPHPVITDS
jgi:thiamine-phosphate pyrophosphorylase